MYITHYTVNLGFSFKRITEYSDQDQIKIANTLSQIKGGALNRFTNFNYYYKRRVETEHWLYLNALHLGIDTKVSSPWYFVLCENPLMAKGFGKSSVAYRIPLKNIQDNDITFTIGDSIALYYSPINNKQVYTKKSFMQVIQNNITLINDNFSILDEQHRYIEVQIWNDKYIKQLIST